MPYTRRLTNNPSHPYQGHAYQRGPPPSLHDIHPVPSWERQYQGPRPLAPLGHSNLNYQDQYQQQHYRYQGVPCQYSSSPETFHAVREEEFCYQYPPYEQGRRSHPAVCIQKPHFSFSRPQQHILPPPRSGSTSFANTTEPRDPAPHAIRDEDVVCGRGAPSLHHPGNIYFRQVIHQFQSRYLAARRIDKPAIACRVVELIQERGGEFIKRTKAGGGWEAIGEHRAYEKACQALREGAPELRRKLAAREIAAAALCLDRLSSRERESPVGSDEEDARDERSTSRRDSDSKSARI